MRTSPTIVVDNAYFLGNKVMAVFGNLSMVGVPRPVTWTKLAAPVSSGATSLTLAVPVDWRVGEEIAISPTTYNVSQLETATIAGVSADGRTLTLAAPLSFGHAGHTLATPEWAAKGGAPSLVLSAAVGLLTRNVLFRGANISQVTPNYGAVVSVGNLYREAEDKLFTGNVQLAYVQFHNCGQQGMQNPALWIDYQAGVPQRASNITGVAFSHSLNYAVVMENVRNVIFRDNVVHRTFGTAVSLDDDSSGATVVNNLVIGTYRSPDEVMTWVRPFAAFFITAPVAVFSDNVAAGTEDNGFVLYPELCGASPQRILRNEVRTHHV